MTDKDLVLICFICENLIDFYILIGILSLIVFIIFIFIDDIKKMIQYILLKIKK